MKTLREIIGQCIGEASMLWTETPKGEFLSGKASDLVDKTIAEINNHLDEVALKEEMDFR